MTPEEQQVVDQIIAERDELLLALQHTEDPRVLLDAAVECIRGLIEAERQRLDERTNA